MTVHQNADNWAYSHVAVHATNRLRPFAVQGGIVLTAAVDREHGDIIYGAGQVQAVEDFLADLSVAGGPELQQVIADELERLGPLDDFVGMTMEEARGDVIGYVVLYLPLVQKSYSGTLNLP